MKIFVVGSMDFFKEFAEMKIALAKLGHTVTIPLYVDELLKGEIDKEVTDQRKQDFELIKSNFEEVKRNDAILVINITKNDIENYIGANTFLEIAFAHILNKKIFTYNPLPNLPYINQELTSMKPIVTKQDLTLLNL